MHFRVSPSKTAMYRLARCLIVIASLSIPSVAQATLGQALPVFLRGDDQFGAKLLLLAQSEAPKRNVIVSPLSLTVLFAALQDNLEDRSARSEIGNAFGWGEYPQLRIPSRMLLAAFEPRPQTSALKTRRRGVLSAPSPGGAWISNLLQYRGKDTFSKQFTASAEKYFGIKLVSVGAHRPTTTNFKDATGIRLPTLFYKNDFLVNSDAHLQTAWSGNTFSMSRAHRGTFRTAAGDAKQVDMLDSELGNYSYAKTDSFEAAALPCDEAYMVVVLPAPGKSVQDLERLLETTPDAVGTALREETGIVTIPTFHFRFEAALRQYLAQMGVKKVFDGLGPIVRIPQSHLTEVFQRTDIQVDKEGILASAETVIGGVYGGIVNRQAVFQMDVNRPFVFLIRDRATNALMFIGTVQDPSQR